MGLWNTLQRIFRQKANAAMTAADDPIEALELVFRDQSTALAKTRGDLATVLSAEKRLGAEGEKLQASHRQYIDLARDAVVGNDDKRARTMLVRASAAARNAQDIERHQADVRRQRESLETVVEEMRASLENLRVRLQAARAQTAAARATIGANEAVLPIGERGAERALTLENASNALQNMRSRAEALTDLRHSTSMDPVGASEMDAVAPSESEIDRQLAALKAETALPE